MFKIPIEMLKKNYPAIIFRRLLAVVGLIVESRRV